MAPQILDPDDDLPDDIPVGAVVYIRPAVRDAQGNLAADAGALAVDVIAPDRSTHALELKRASDGLDPETTFEPRVMGMHWMDVLLGGAPVGTEMAR